MTNKRQCCALALAGLFLLFVIPTGASARAAEGGKIDRVREKFDEQD